MSSGVLQFETMDDDQAKALDCHTTYSGLQSPKCSRFGIFVIAVWQSYCHSITMAANAVKAEPINWWTALISHLLDSNYLTQIIIRPAVKHVIQESFWAFYTSNFSFFAEANRPFNCNPRLEFQAISHSLRCLHAPVQLRINFSFLSQSINASSVFWYRFLAFKSKS